MNILLLKGTREPSTKRRPIVPTVGGTNDITPSRIPRMACHARGVGMFIGYNFNFAKHNIFFFQDIGFAISGISENAAMYSASPVGLLRGGYCVTRPPSTTMPISNLYFLGRAPSANTKSLEFSMYLRSSGSNFS